MATQNEVTFRLPRCRRSVPRARALLCTVLGGWEVGQDAVDEAELVLSELVTNALRVRAPKDRQVGVRVAWQVEDGLLRLEVSDAGTGRPEARRPGNAETHGRGLLLVEAVAQEWGVDHRASGIGKTVWATLKAPEFVAEAAPMEVAAVTVRAGQSVRVWGTWHRVRSVRSERYASGGLAVVIGLDDGPALRLPAAEPLPVRDGVSSSRVGEEDTPG